MKGLDKWFERVKMEGCDNSSMGLVVAYRRLACQAIMRLAKAQNKALDTDLSG